MAKKKVIPQAIIEVENPVDKLVPLEEQLQEPEVVVPEVQEKPVGRKRLGIGKFVLAQMEAFPHWTNAQLLSAVAEEFPEAETTKACIAWYRTKYRQDQAKAQLVQAETVEA
jgi:hypothetical protein